jgi:glucosamine--fructose-6-phosphate aminotransferase (isomerizing)
MTATSPGALILDEIASQGETWQALLDSLGAHVESVRPLFTGIDDIVFSGCGSGLNAAWFAAPLFQAQAGFSARAVPAADLSFFPETVFVPSRRTLAVFFSRSGRTTEILQAQARLKDRGVSALAITCSPGSALASSAEGCLSLEAVDELAVATTRSFSGMLLAALFLAAAVSHDRSLLDGIQELPARCRSLMPTSQRLGEALAARCDLRSFAFVGSGALYGLAREAQLKMKETTLLPSDSYPVLDYRHGPQSTVSPQTLVTVLMSDRAKEEERRFALDMKSLGATLLVNCGAMDPDLRTLPHFSLEVGSDLDERLRGPLYMPAIQFMAARRSLAQGLDPDFPPHLSHWIDTSVPEAGR